MTNHVSNSPTTFHRLHLILVMTNRVSHSRTISHRLHTILGLSNRVSKSCTIFQRPCAIFRMTLFVMWQIVSGAMTLFAGVSGNSRSRPFPRMKASDSLSRIMGMDFFIPFLFPNFRNVFFSFPFRSRILGMFFFIFPSRSKIVGMHFFYFLPVPEFTMSQTRVITGIGKLWEISGLQ